MGKRIYNKQTGEWAEYDSVDAREMLQRSPDLYSTEGPDEGKNDDKPSDLPPINVANVENEFRREPVGDDVPEAPREQPIIRNPVTDQPRLADRPDEPAVAAAASEPAPVKVEIVQPGENPPEPKAASKQAEPKAAAPDEKAKGKKA